MAVVTEKRYSRTGVITITEGQNKAERSLTKDNVEFKPSDVHINFKANTVSIGIEYTNTQGSLTETNHVLRTFNEVDLPTNLKNILNNGFAKQLYSFIEDFSEHNGATEIK